MKNKQQYPLEVEAEKLLKAIRLYFFTRPKNKMDRMAHTMEIISWLLLTAAIIFRMR